MNLLKKYSSKLFLKQWAIGVSKASIATLIRERNSELQVSWVNSGDPSISQADPFIFRGCDGRVNIFFESVGISGLDGKIAHMVCDASLRPISDNVILDTNDHLSYPFVYQENQKTYIFPENARSGALYCYEFDELQGTFVNKRQIVALPLLDSTIVKFNEKYWLFATIKGPRYNSDLYIFHSESLLGPYHQHKKNPVKSDLHGSRPAGSFINVDNQLYRPAQNCENYYGESIAINKLIKLTEDDFEESEHMLIKPDREAEYNYGIHTINVLGDFIIVDGQKARFQPMRQLYRKVRRVIF